ncbi:MAG: winged helix-turn-helix domain-containing protein [Vulcanisaeta sp.]|jgi:predicted ArsR family transcriptional regulator|nr:winged helix-turn-helix domain-containing protein [Vulcanisaeta sp.]
MNLEDFNGLRVKVVLELIHNGPMTQTALVRELGTNAVVLKKHLNWLVRNGIVKTYGSVATLYEVNTEHPLIKWVVGLINPQGSTKPHATT